MTSASGPVLSEKSNPGGPGQGLTFRAVCIGLVCVGVVCWASLYSNMIQKSSYLAGTLMSVAVIFTFLVVVLGLNTLLKLIFPGRGLSRAELVVIFIMTLLATALPTFGWGEMFFPQVTAFRYYASAQNKWQQTLWPHIESSRIPLLPTEQNGAVKYLFEGLPRDKTVPFDIPWGDWVKPLVSWFGFFVPLFFLMFCVCVVLRKQWVERERLVFPLLQVPMEIIQAEDPHKRLNRFFANRLLWMGVMVPVLLDGVVSIGHWGFFPKRMFFWQVSGLFGFHSINFRFNWPMMGFTYLISLDLAFSLWFFSWAKLFVSQLMNYVGWSLGPREYYSGSDATISHFCIGAIIVMVGINMWGARHHLKDVCRKAFLGARDVDDSSETMSYRLSVIGGLACAVWLWVWLWMSGMQWWLPPLFIGLSFAIFLAITRLVIEGGAPTAVAGFIPQWAIPRLIGTSVLTHQSILAMGMSFAWISDLRVFLVPFLAHSVRLADAVKMKRRRLPWLVMATMVVALVVTTITLFWLCYSEGGVNLNRWFFRGGGAQRAPKFAHEYIVRPISTGSRNFAGRWACTIGGGVFLGFLAFMRHRFLWWPLNPLGLPFIIPTWPVVMCVWIMKSLILKYGGVRLFRRLKPLFLGLILGKFASAGLWFIVDISTGVVGHVLYNR